MKINTAFRYYLWILFSAILINCAAPIPKQMQNEKLKSQDGILVERRISRHADGRPEENYYVYQDSLRNYVKHGLDTHYYLNGQIKFEEHYKNGLLDSTTEFWFPNGNKQGELPYQNGKLNGMAITWFPNGKKKSEKKWENGKLDGLDLEWDEKGKLLKKILWKENQPTKILLDQ